MSMCVMYINKLSHLQDTVYTLKTSETTEEIVSLPQRTTDTLLKREEVVIYRGTNIYIQMIINKNFLSHTDFFKLNKNEDFFLDDIYLSALMHLSK